MRNEEEEKAADRVRYIVRVVYGRQTKASVQRRYRQYTSRTRRYGGQVNAEKRARTEKPIFIEEKRGRRQL